mmetsp:Transcript_11067/g.25619  ORF Transcript_11067/g.25619 Transcript_11067/m.25619 type:complete len:431 (-) Transcript_11067:484-1776(-)
MPPLAISPTVRVRSSPKAYDEEDPASASWVAHRKHFFVLSSAGKPIFSRFGDEAKLAALAGVLQALVSCVGEGGDTIRSVHSGAHTAVFLIRGPLYLVAVSRAGDTVAHLLQQLVFMHAQIISLLTSKIEEVFVRNASYDLRSLLGGTDRVIRGAIRAGSYDPALLLQAVPCLWLPWIYRVELGKLLTALRPPEVLHGVLLAKGHLVQTLHPKKEELHPMDLLLIINAVTSTSSFREGESWLPLCLPHFNPRAFVYAHISFVGREIALVLLSSSREAFGPLSALRNQVISALRLRTELSIALERAVREPLCDVADSAVPEACHLMYKLNGIQQCVATRCGGACPYRERAAMKRLMRRYQLAHARVHAAEKPLKEIYQASDTEVIIGRCTPEYEIYIAFGPLVTKPIVDSACQRILRWLKTEERSLFLLHK